MKAKDLMIGDWVQGNPCGQCCDRNNNTYYKIATLDIVDHCWGYSSCGAIVELKYDDISSIPLTPEILEKNGFLANKHIYPYPYYEYEVKEIKVRVGFAFPQGNRTSYKEPWVCIDTECVYIEHLPCIFVHQLQQVLRLCGIEKEIEL